MSCISKKNGYLSRKEAKQAASRHRGDGKLRVYKCETCPYWHLTKCNAITTAFFKDLRAGSAIQNKTTNERPNRPYGYATDKVLTRRSSIQYLADRPEAFRVFGEWVKHVSL